VVEDTLYTANLDGVVTAYHRTEGYVKWRKKMEGGVTGALSFGKEKLFVGDMGGNLCALQPETGEKIWCFKINSVWNAPPLVVRDRVFASTSADEIYALLLDKGEEIWHFVQHGDEKMTVKKSAEPAFYGNELYQGFLRWSRGGPFH